MKMTIQLTLPLVLTILTFVPSIQSQCVGCTSDQGCCMSPSRKDWSCCTGQTLTSNNQSGTPWNFNMQISYDVYVWDCSPSTMDPSKKYTNVSCLLDGRWSLDHLTFQLRSIPSNEMKSIVAKYTMKNSKMERVVFQADFEWALTLPVDRNQKAAIYDTLEFNYGGFDYTYYFGYGPYPHCPRC